MDKIELPPGVLLTPQRQINGIHGSVYHGIKYGEAGYSGFKEAYFSTVDYNMIKPWKKHLRMTLNILVPVGEIRFVLYDDRQSSAIKNLFSEIILSPKNYYRLTVPPNIWLAFRGESHETNILMNFSNMLHDPNEVERRDLGDIYYNW